MDNEKRRALEYQASVVGLSIAEHIISKAKKHEDIKNNKLDAVDVSIKVSDLELIVKREKTRLINNYLKDWSVFDVLDNFFRTYATFDAIFNSSDNPRDQVDRKEKNLQFTVNVFFFEARVKEIRRKTNEYKKRQTSYPSLHPKENMQKRTKLVYRKITLLFDKNCVIDTFLLLECCYPDIKEVDYKYKEQRRKYNNRLERKLRTLNDYFKEDGYKILPVKHKNQHEKILLY